MSFIGAFNRLIGSVKVVEKNQVVWVHGVDPDAIERGIKQIWNTTRIASNLFIHVDYSSFSFPSFFAAEVVYIMNKMTQETDKTVSVRTLSKIIDAIVENTWLSKTNPALNRGNVMSESRLDFNKLNNMVFQPLEFQMDFLKSYDRLVPMYGLNGFILNGAPGSGKTFTSLALAECAGAERIVVICPPNAVERVWKDSVSSLFKTQQTYWVAKFGKPYNGERVLIAHYEALNKVHDLINNIRGFKTVVILDESHNLNELTALRTELFMKLCKTLNCKNVIYASGTPVKAMGAELIPILRVLDPLFNEDTEARYRKIYGKDATKALDILKHRFGLISFRIEKKELKLLPPIIEKVKVKSPNSKQFTLPAIADTMKKYIEERKKYYESRARNDELDFYRILDKHEKGLTNKAKYEEYRANLKRLIAYTKRGNYRDAIEEMKACNGYELRILIPSLSPDDAKLFKDIRSNVKYVMLKIRGECLGRILGRARIDCHVDMVNYVNFKSLVNSTKKKTLIFTSYVEVLDKTVETTKKLGFSPLAVYGKTNNELASIIHDFETNQDLDPLVATFNSLSTAVPMTMADVIIMLNAPFRAYIQDQAISRINRLGADTQTYVYMVELDTGNVPNISSRSLDILAWSQQQVAAIVGGDIPFDITEMNEMSGEFSLGTEGISIESFRVESPTRTNPMYLNW